jgi:protein-L-isoaspartate(D-aspartate) O-methyltransferase
MNIVDHHNADNDIFKTQRDRMIQSQLAGRDISDKSILEVMRKVPRHLFVGKEYQNAAYDDNPQPIGYDQTISQPYIVASMTEHLALKKTDRVLEIGTGSGYQTAVLAELASEVYSIEIIPELHTRALHTLRSLGYNNVYLKVGNGCLGWPEKGPFHAIIVTAAAKTVPSALFDELADDGKLIIPLKISDSEVQELILYQKWSNGIRKRTLYSVRFVPLIGSHD